MSEYNRLELLTNQMHLEHAEDVNCLNIPKRKQDEVYISKAVLPSGRHISLLKTLLTSVCERNCYYCPFRSDRDLRRATFQPDEFAKLFMYMHNTGKVEGIFLSSGIVGGGIKAQDKLLDTAEIIRKKYNYKGYLHLKIMPGVQKDQVFQAMLLADRISINLEAPNARRLKDLAPKKHFYSELIDPIIWAEDIRKTKSPSNAWNQTWPTTVTQFVVGGADESDLEILKTTSKLHKEMGLTRAYFSGFNPVPDTPLENKPPTLPVRQNRLYQASYLLRDYGFTVADLPFQQFGNLPLDIDPKLAWAKLHLRYQPVEVNLAPPEQLLRVPGIGIKGVRTIIQARGDQKIRSLACLSKMRIQSRKAAPYILLDGYRPSYQETIF